MLGNVLGALHNSRVSQAQPLPPFYRGQSEVQTGEVRWLPARKQQGQDSNAGMHAHHTGKF